MMNAIYALLSHYWSGLVIAAIVGVFGMALTRIKRRRIVRFAGYAVCLLALLSMAGSIAAIVRIRRAEKGHPPMGRLVDVGGYRLNILAEGDARGGPALVWIAGGHAQGLSMYHLHKAMRSETRSIIFDRPGMGWSDTGPLPNSTKKEAEELNRLLDNAGEKGPFIMIGHSYGGLLAANYARRYQKKTAALILLDPTPPDVFTYLPGGTGPNIPGGLVRGSQISGLMKLFGLWSDPEEMLMKREDELGKLMRTIAERLADVRPAIKASNISPAGDWVSASLFSEWFDPKLVAELIVYDGELGEMPVYLITPENDTTPQSIEQQLGIKGDDLARALNFLKRARMRYLGISSKSELIHTPAGTSHNYPYEVPEFVLEHVRNVLAKSRTVQ